MKAKRQFLLLIMVLALFLFSHEAYAAEKEPLVLMPLRGVGIDKAMLGSMEAALVEGLQAKYKVFSGPQVHKKLQQGMYEKGSGPVSRKDFNETKYMQDIAIEFQSELVATAVVLKRSSGYILTLNIFDDMATYSKSIPCKGCDEFDVINQLKLLAGDGHSLVAQPSSSAAPSVPVVSGPSESRFDLGDLEAKAREEEAEMGTGENFEVVELKNKWDKYLGEMKKSFSQVEQYESRNISKELKLSAWEKFLSAYKEDNPYSSDDESLREKAKGSMELIKTAKAGNSASFEDMVLVKGGCFQMGNVFGDGFSNERPVHKVCLDDFYMDKVEVMQSAYKKITGTNPAYFKGSSKPVEKVTWDEAKAYCGKLGKRLPTEAEWEYAARSGGKKEKWAGTSRVSDVGDYAWYKSNSDKNTHSVGEKNPNGLGLYDMTGNVWEWVADWYEKDYYKNSPENNPKGPSNGKDRVLRGGSWNYRARGTSAAFRGRGNPTKGNGNSGFRCAKSL